MIFPANRYKTKKYHLSLDYFFENNEYCERINYESWMEENIIKESGGQGKIAPPSKTMEAIFSDAIYDVSYSNDKGFYFVVYVDTNHVERILSMSGCIGHEINIKEIVRITNGIEVNYKELNENLLYVKCNDKYKIPAFILNLLSFSIPSLYAILSAVLKPIPSTSSISL